MRAMHAAAELPQKPISRHQRITRGVSDYHQELVAEARQLTEAGWTDAEISFHFGVSVPTMWLWRKRHPEFAEAFKLGKQVPDDRIEGTLYRVAAGYEYVEQQAIKVKTGEHTEEVRVVDVRKVAPPSEPSLRFWLKNRRREEWTDRTEVAMSGAVDLNVKTDPKAFAIAMLATIRAALEEPPLTIDAEPQK